MVFPKLHFFSYRNIKDLNENLKVLDINIVVNLSDKKLKILPRNLKVLSFYFELLLMP